MDPATWELYEAGEEGDEVAVIVRLGAPGQPAPEGLRIVARFGEIATCRVRRGALPDLRGSAEIVSVKAARGLVPDLVKPQAEEEGDEGPWNDLRRPDGLRETGRGVVLGVVDWGFDFTHPDFRNPDGGTRLLALWDQRGGPRDPANPYGYGTIHAREAIDRALAAPDPFAALGYHPADADSGRGAHGTHVLGIAAGNGQGGGPAGLAPEADLVCVHMAGITSQRPDRLGNSVSLLEAVHFIDGLAARLPPLGPEHQAPAGRPWVINLSMGKHAEPHDGTTLVEQGLDAALRAKPGCAASLSAGNYRVRRVHASGQLRPREKRLLVWEVFEADEAPNELEVWYSGRDALSVGLRFPDGSTAAEVPLDTRAPVIHGGRRVGTVYNRAREPNTLDNQIRVYLYREAPAGAWEVLLRAEDVVDGRYHCWIEREPARPARQSRFRDEDADPSSSTGSICNGLRTIAVGAYDAHAPGRDLAPFSSEGPTRDGRVKPDLCAPGVRVLAARSYPRGGAAGENPRPLLTRMSGTSMASPHVAGAIALMFEAAGRRLRIEETRNLLLAAARPAADWEGGPGGREALLNRLGSGRLDVERAVAAARAVASAPVGALPVPAPPLAAATAPEAPVDAATADVPDGGALPGALQPGTEAKMSDDAIPSFGAPELTTEAAGTAATAPEGATLEEAMPEVPPEEFEAVLRRDLAGTVGDEARPEETAEHCDAEAALAAEAPDDVSAAELNAVPDRGGWDEAVEEAAEEEAGWEEGEAATPEVPPEEFEAVLRRDLPGATEEWARPEEAVERCDTEATLAAEAPETLATGETMPMADAALDPTAPAVGLAEAALYDPRFSRYPSRFLHEIAGQLAGPGAALPEADPARIFDALVFGADPALRERVEAGFKVVAHPWEAPREALLPGDLLLRRLDGARGHAAVLVEGELLAPEDLEALGFAGESHRPGGYAHVIEPGPWPHRAADGFARRITGPGDRLPFNQIVLRPRWTAGEAAAGEAAAEGAIPAGAFGEATDRTNPAYVRWVQASLNRVAGAGLAEDGILGPRSRAAIRAFQARSGLAADGVVGPRTEAALVAAGADPPPGAGGGPAPPPVSPPAPRIDPADPRIDGDAKLSLERLLRRPATRGPAEDMLAALDRRALAGIWGDDLRGAADLAARLGALRWDLVGAGRDAEVLGAPGEPHALVFRARLRGEATALDGALVEAWGRYRQRVPPAPPAPGVIGALDPPRWGPILRPALGPHAALRAGNAVRFLIDGPETFRAMAEAMRGARGAGHYIYLLGWILQDGFELIPGDAASTPRRLLADAAARGVQVRAVLWAKPPGDNLAETARIMALPGGAAIRDNDTPNRVVGSHHQKVLLVKGEDGLVGFCGGLDMNEDRIRVVGAGKGEPLHDTHCRVAGPAAWDLLQTFIRRWDHSILHTGLDLLKGALLGRSEPVPPPRPVPMPPAASSTGAACSVAIARTFNPVTPRTRVPRERDIRALLLRAIGAARRFIYMEEQYLVGLEAAAALRAALPSIAHLTILIPASEITDMPCRWKFRRDFLSALTGGLPPAVSGKVQVFRLVNPPPPAPPVVGEHTYVHAKTWVFDDELAVIGTANCNRRGWQHDSEVNAFVFDDAMPVAGPGFAQALRMALWSEHLGAPRAALLDGVASAALWRAPTAAARVRPYLATAGTDGPSDAVCEASRGVVDPSVP